MLLGSVAAISNQISRKGQLQADGANELLAMTLKSCLLEADKDALRSVINHAVSMEPSEVVALGSADSKTQCGLHCHNYFTPSVWVVLCDKMSTDEQKNAALADSMINMGLLHGSEQTMSKMTALKFVSRFPELPGPGDLESLRALKTFMKSRLKVRRSGAARGPSVYPQAVQVFKKEYPALAMAAYANEQPMECPLQSSDLDAIHFSIPCRSTRAGATSTAFSQYKMSAGMKQAMALMAAMKQQHCAQQPLQHQLQQQPGDVDLSKFTFFGPRPDSTSQSSNLQGVIQTR